jgi:hypothetical protein
MNRSDKITTSDYNLALLFLCMNKNTARFISPRFDEIAFGVGVDKRRVRERGGGVDECHCVFKLPVESVASIMQNVIYLGRTDTTWPSLSPAQYLHSHIHVRGADLLAQCTGEPDI